MGNQAQIRKGSTAISTSTRNFPNRLCIDTQVYLGSAELAADAFMGQGPAKSLADIYLLARQRLTAAGVTSISGGGRCTCSEAGDFFLSPRWCDRSHGEPDLARGLGSRFSESDDRHPIFLRPKRGVAVSHPHNDHGFCATAAFFGYFGGAAPQAPRLTFADFCP